MMKLSKLIDLFIADVCAGKFNETEKGYRQKLRQLERFAKNKPITGKLIKGFMHDMKTRTHHQVGYKIVEGGLSIYTIKTTFQTTRHFCKWLFQNGYIADDLSPMIKIPNPPPPTPKAVSEDTVIQLIKAALNNTDEWARARDIAIIYYLRDTGGRVGGLTNALLSNTDLKTGKIDTVEKGKNVRVYINNPTITAIRNWLIYRTALEPYTEHLFISNRTKRGLTRQGVARMLDRYAEKAGILDRRNAHSFRHAFARDYLEDGGEITQLAGLLHHSSIWVTTTYYARWSDRELQNTHAVHSPIKSLSEMEIGQ